MIALLAKHHVALNRDEFDRFESAAAKDTKHAVSGEEFIDAIVGKST